MSAPSWTIVASRCGLRVTMWDAPPAACFKRAALAVLDGLPRGARVRPVIERVTVRVEARLAAEPGALLAWESLPLKTYFAELPGDIQSSWVFVLRAGATSGAETSR